MTVSTSTTDNVINKLDTQAIPTSFDVRTMPAKFLSSHPVLSGGGHSSSLKKNILIGLALIIFIGGAMGLAAWFFLKSVKKDQPPLTNNQPAVNAESSTLNQGNSNPTPTTTDETLLQVLLDVSQWQTFADPTYYYAFKYPATWLKSDDSLASVPGATSRLSLAGDPGIGQIYLTVYDNGSDDSLLNWLTQSFGLDEIDLEPYKLNNNDAYRYENVLNNSFSIYVSYQGRFYALEFIKSDKAVIAEVYNQFLVNWQFTLPEEEVVTPGGELDTTPVVDTDTDALTDVEEDLYTTDKNNPDTDGDSFSDSQELINLYNPKVAGSARLYDSDLVKTHVNNFYHYNILYPASWQIKETEGSVIFQAASGEFVQVIVEANSKNYKDIKKWYQEYLGLDQAAVSSLTIAGTESAIMSPDKMRIYFLFGNNIYSLIYNPSLRQNGNFLTTFAMMIKSFKLMTVDQPL